MIDLLCLLEFYNTYETDEIYHKIAEKMLENFSVVSEMSISELAEFLFVSQSTIYRFVKMMGYENYNQMKAGQITFLENYYLQGRYTSKNAKIHRFDNYIDYMFEKIHVLKEKNIHIQVEQLIEMILSSDEIIFVGMPMPSFVWRLQMELVMLKKKTSAFLNPENQYQAIMHAKSNPLVIGIQYLIDSSIFYSNMVKDIKNHKFKSAVIYTSKLASYIKNVDLPIYIDGDNNESDLFLMEFIFNYIGHRLNTMILDKPNCINL